MWCYSILFACFFLIDSSATQDWSETIDCHFIDNNKCSVQLICDKNLSRVYPKDDCHLLLFEDSSKEEQRNKLKVLRASECIFAKLDRSLETTFPHLSELDNSFSHVDNFLYFPLWRFDSLQKWNLSHNSLMRIVEGYFTAAPVLIEIDLSFNEIFDIHPLGFDGVFRLNRIDLSHNRIVNLNAGTFKDHNELKELNLSFNRLTKIDNSAFPVNKRVEFLWFDKDGDGSFIQFMNRPSKDSIAVRIFGNDDESTKCNCTTNEIIQN